MACRHGLAAILAAVMRGALHGHAAPHRLFGGSHADAVELIRGQSHEHCEKKGASGSIHAPRVEIIWTVSQGDTSPFRRAALIGALPP